MLSAKPLSPEALLQISNTLNLSLHSLTAVIALLDEGGTVPFIARYRKEATGNLDEVQIRDIEEKLAYFRDLLSRRETILASILEQGKLTDELKAKIEATFDRSELEDLYLPFRPKRRTKATIAREKGLEPLADYLWAQQASTTPLLEFAQTFISPEREVASIEEALEGARHIVAERISESAELRKATRHLMFEEGVIVSHRSIDGVDEQEKFKMYYDYREAVKTIPSHRMLAIRRGEAEAVLYFLIELEPLRATGTLRTKILETTGDWTPPAGPISVLGIDPGLRTGCKVAVVDETGKFLAHDVLYLHTSKSAADGAADRLVGLLAKHNVRAIAIGNGTASRETDAFVRELLRAQKLDSIFSVTVSESGASVYSASDVARQEFPDLDLTVRGAISIARRLQDPLSELVKVDPKSIGVGQYQHDVDQRELQQSLETVIESCVNRVGVDLNTSSWTLLRYVAGVTERVALNIVSFRDEHGRFRSRSQLTKVPGIGAKTFEQAAGFLRIRGGDNPLDATAVHPESYPVVEQIATSLNTPLGDLVANPSLLSKIDTRQIAAGAFTAKDILEELRKPGRDPRDQFVAPSFNEKVREFADVQPEMVLEGVVTNVTKFGAFVDIGVHQDGLVHISELSNRFIKDPSEAVKAGQIVKVKVLSADLKTKRIALSMKALMSGGATKAARPATPRTQAPIQPTLNEKLALLSTKWKVS